MDVNTSFDESEVFCPLRSLSFQDETHLLPCPPRFGDSGLHFDFPVMQCPFFAFKDFSHHGTWFLLDSGLMRHDNFLPHATTHTGSATSSLPKGCAWQRMPRGFFGISLISLFARSPLTHTTAHGKTQHLCGPEPMSLMGRSTASTDPLHMAVLGPPEPNTLACMDPRRGRGISPSDA